MDEKRPVLLLDVDGVLADFMSAILGHVKELTGQSFVESEITEWDIFEFFERKSLNIKAACLERLAEPGLAAGLEPYPGSIEWVDRLKGLTSLYIVTAPADISPTWAHERTWWLNRHYRIPADRIIYTASKHLVRGDIFVDDRPEFVCQWKKYNPEGIAVLWDHPYNRAQNDLYDYRVDGWDKLLEIILKHSV
jgi:5'(3')-deoxyribonucleotidase